MPGLPGGLVTLQQYLSANQPAVDQMNKDLLGAQQTALNPAVATYNSALSGLQQQGLAGAQRTAQDQQNTQAERMARGSAAGTPVNVGGIPYSYSAANDPNAAAQLSDAQAALTAAGAKANAMTSDAGARANTLYGMYGSKMSGYTTADAGLDAALSGSQTTATTPGQNGVNDPGQKLTGTTAPLAGTSQPSDINGNPTSPGEGPIMKPKRSPNIFEPNG